LEDLLARDAGERSLHDAGGTDVAIVVGVAEDLAGVVEEAEIDAPGIHADAGQRRARFGGGFAQAGF